MSRAPLDWSLTTQRVERPVPAGIWQPLPILDRGHVRLVDFMGSDERVVEAARQSTQKGFLGWGVEQVCDRCRGSGTNEPEHGPGSLCRQCGGKKTHVNAPGDEKLLAYLYERRHDTPFESAEAVFEIRAPIFVFREWHRHRTQSYNEMSARYAPLPADDYRPTPERCLLVSGKNRQAGAIADAQELTHESALAWLASLDAVYEHLEAVYQDGLRRGIPKEIARLSMSVGRYSQMWAKTNLRNWLAFLTLRADSAAQLEIRHYAYAVGLLLSRLFPRTFALFLGAHRKPPDIDAGAFERSGLLRTGGRT